MSTTETPTEQLSGTQSFPRALRLLSAGEFDQVFKARRVVSTPAFRVHYAERGLTHPRLGLALAKRAVPRSVDRNRIKRCLREAFRRKQHDLPPFDLVIRAQPAARTLSAELLQRDLDQLWLRLQSLSPGRSAD